MLNTRIHRVDKVFLAATLLTVAGLKSQAITVQEVGVSPYETPTISCAGIGTVTVYAGVVNLVVDGSSMKFPAPFRQSSVRIKLQADVLVQRRVTGRLGLPVISRASV